MKKTGLFSAVALMLAACANTEDMTLDRMIFGHEVKPADTTLSEMFFGEECKSCKKKGQNIKTVEVEVVDADVSYHLQKRGERYIEIAPEVYAIAATRATNRMLDEARPYYESNASSFIYITDLKKEDRQLPDGVYNAAKATKNIVTNSRTFKVTESLEEADYILEAVIDNANTPEYPVLVYKLILFDTENNKLDEWTETLRRVRNDDNSWW